MALRDALVIDKWRRCAPPDKRRRRAVARLLYFIRSPASPKANNWNLQNITVQRKTTVRARSRPAKPLSVGSVFPRTQNIFLFTVYPFRVYGFLSLRFTSISCRVNTVSLRGRLGFCRIVRGFSRFQVIPFFNPLCYSVFIAENKAIFCWDELCSVAFCWDFGSCSCDFGYKKCLTFLLRLWYSAFIL